MTHPRILIGMPAFRAAGLIREALQSISNQEHRDFRVIISVDDSDLETEAACQSFLTDSRFSLVRQNRRLGWAENINWLMSQPDFDFFCYWQHDDFTSTNYISELLQNSFNHPSAVCYFCGIQWLGELTHWMPSACVVGLPIVRTMSVFENLNGIPFRGLIRREAINRVGPIRITDHESAFEEFVWVGKLAREGNLQYVDGPTYFKRARRDSTHAKWHGKDRLWRREVWLEFGLGMLETIWPLVHEPERITALCTVLDRLCLPKEGRFCFYDGPVMPFASDFVVKALELFEIPSLERAIAGPPPEPFAGGLAGELLDRAIQSLISGGTASTREQNTFQFRAGGNGIDLLLDGWPYAENWGTWSDGPRAGLRLPVGTRRGKWKAILTFRLFGKEGETVPMQITLPTSSRMITWDVPANQVVQKELCVESHSTDIPLRFTFPQVKSPQSIGLSEDRRCLGIGLISMNLTEPA